MTWKYLFVQCYLMSLERGLTNPMATDFALNLHKCTVCADNKMLSISTSLVIPTYSGYQKECPFTTIISKKSTMIIIIWCARSILLNINHEFQPFIKQLIWEELKVPLVNNKLDNIAVISFPFFSYTMRVRIIKCVCFMLDNFRIESFVMMSLTLPSVGLSVLRHNYYEFTILPE